VVVVTFRVSVVVDGASVVVALTSEVVVGIPAVVVEAVVALTSEVVVGTSVVATSPSAKYLNLGAASGAPADAFCGTVVVFLGLSSSGKLDTATSRQRQMNPDPFILEDAILGLLARTVVGT